MSSFEAVLDQFGRKRVLVVGDIMLDRFVYGHVSRISPEAPVPVVRVRERKDAMGGAANVAQNVAALGATVELVASAEVGTVVAASVAVQGAAVADLSVAATVAASVPVQAAASAGLAADSVFDLSPSFARLLALEAFAAVQ